jgi:hypothetical protein
MKEIKVIKSYFLTEDQIKKIELKRIEYEKKLKVPMNSSATLGKIIEDSK